MQWAIQTTLVCNLGKSYWQKICMWMAPIESIAEVLDARETAEGERLETKFIKNRNFGKAIAIERITAKKMDQQQ